MIGAPNGNGHSLKRKRVYVVNQFKYDLDSETSLLKRFLIEHFFCPLIEFCGEHLNFAPWDRKDADGSYSRRECQGVFSEQWQAEAEAAKYPHAWVTPFILDDALPGAATLVPGIHPNAATAVYDRINGQVVEVPKWKVERLERKLEASAIRT